MKVFFYLFILSCIMYSGHCQLQDSLLYKVGYEYKKLSENQGQKKYTGDSLVVEIGSRFSVCYSEWNRLAEEYVAKEIEKQVQSQKGQIKIDLATTPLPKFGMMQQVFKMFKQNKIIVTDRILKDRFFYEDSLDMFHWELLPDTATISGYKCQKATTFFRGRQYIAWFSDQVPLHNGPLKFGGLPGLIIQLRDTENLFFFKLTNFEKVSGKMEVAFNPSNFISTNRRKLEELKKAMFENPQAFLNGQGGTFQYKTDVPLSSKKYNPIELQ